MLRKSLLYLICLLIAVLTAGQELRAQTQSQAFSPEWLRLYQYDKKLFGERSAVTADRFFFAGANGRRNPEIELSAAFDAFEHPQKLFGTQNQPAACVFPARLKVLEKISHKTFPKPDCKDLEEWIQRIDADEVYLVYVGAYAGNPASILGHSFLRFANSKRAASQRKGNDLLSYSVGFTAQADPTDGKLNYMFKGVMGGYPGSYEIEPHYMKVGLYNNSEARDLWEYKVRLDPAKVDLLVRYLWELTFNAEIPYYFVDENCSYRLLKMLEAVEPTMDVSSKFPGVVLPPETLRAMIDEGWVAGDLGFRASLQRRLNYKLALFSGDQRLLFTAAKSSVGSTSRLDDPDVLDALLEYWIYENYAAQAKLPAPRAAIMEATYQRASILKGDRKFRELDDNKIRLDENLAPSFLGHRARSLELQVGVFADANEGQVESSAANFGTALSGRDGSHLTGGFSYTSGIHPFWSGDKAYADISAIEYLGLSADWIPEENLRWQALLIDVKSFENSIALTPRFSWAFDAKATNHCWLCESDNAQGHVGFGGGFSAKSSWFISYLLAHVETSAWLDEGIQALLAPGAIAGVRLDYQSLTLNAEIAEHWGRASRFFDFSRSDIQANMRLTYAYNINQSVFVKARYEELVKQKNESALTVGWSLFF